MTEAEKKELEADEEGYVRIMAHAARCDLDLVRGYRAVVFRDGICETLEKVVSLTDNHSLIMKVYLMGLALYAMGAEKPEVEYRLLAEKLGLSLVDQLKVEEEVEDRHFAAIALECKRDSWALQQWELQ